MSALNVEELLDSTANAAPSDLKDLRSKDRDDRYKSDRHDRDRDRDRDRSRDRDKDRRHRYRSKDRVKKERDADGDVAMESPRS